MEELKPQPQESHSQEGHSRELNQLETEKQRELAELDEEYSDVVNLTLDPELERRNIVLFHRRRDYEDIRREIEKRFESAKIRVQIAQAGMMVQAEPLPPAAPEVTPAQLKKNKVYVYLRTKKGYNKADLTA